MGKLLELLNQSDSSDEPKDSRRKELQKEKLKKRKLEKRKQKRQAKREASEFQKEKNSMRQMIESVLPEEAPLKKEQEAPQIQIEQDEREIQDQQKFERVFQYFKDPPQNAKEQGKQEGKKEEEAKKENGTEGEEKKEQKPLSKKKLKKLRQMEVAQLKMEVKRPDLVEGWDVTAKDPRFLLSLKTVRNSVPVPKHWSQKRKFLQYKRGLTKPPFDLPDFIEATGISKVRNKSDAWKQIRSKPRERIQPKMGRLDIDYQVLHDAFFKHQTKPEFTVHGDVYFQGKEFELKMRKYRPGRISPSLMTALGMPERTPPPWLINMASYGPPPAYPKLRIPGVNASVPSWMTHNKLFTDQNGYTVYADVHGLNKSVYIQRVSNVEHWGDLQKDETESEDEMDEDDEDEEEVEPAPVKKTLEQSTVQRVRAKEGESEGARKSEGQLYQVLEEVEGKASGLAGATKGYKLPEEIKKKEGKV